MQYCSVKITLSFYQSRFDFKIWFVKFGRIQKHIGIKKKKKIKSESIIFCFKLLLIVPAVLFIKLIYQYHDNDENSMKFQVYTT